MGRTWPVPQAAQRPRSNGLAMVWVSDRHERLLQLF